MINSRVEEFEGGSLRELLIFVKNRAVPVHAYIYPGDIGINLAWEEDVEGPELPNDPWQRYMIHVGLPFDMTPEQFKQRNSNGSKA